MTRKVRSTFFSRSIQRSIKALTRNAVSAGTRAVKQALHPSKPAARQRLAVKSKAGQAKALTAVKLPNGFTTGFAGAQHYRLFVPPGAHKTQRLPLLVMLHGCSQTTEAFAISTRMNQIAAKEGFAVLYPEQHQLANLQGCWNWHRTRSGKAQIEADTILATILQVCQHHQSIDPKRIALAGLSAGASMAALLAIRHPAHFRAIAMHSGIAPGMAQSLAGAFNAMRGHGVAAPLLPLAAGTHLPPLLVIQGSADPVVAPTNGLSVAQLWAARENANPVRARTVQRGARHPSILTDYKTKGRLVATLCAIQGLGHAWSGGAASQAYSDAKGPDASRMIWTFADKQFAKVV